MNILQYWNLNKVYIPQTNLYRINFGSELKISICPGIQTSLASGTESTLATLKTTSAERSFELSVCVCAGMCVAL